jgi:probable rRNA maturation factor
MISFSVNLDAASAKWGKAFPNMRKKIEQAAACAFLNAKKPAAFKGRAFAVNILLSDDVTVRKLNKNYRGKDKPTNVLSFPQFALRGLRRSALDSFPPKSAIPLGDIVLAFQTVQRESLQQKKTLENHVIHLIIHGTLHLLGYDHQTLKEAKSMEKLECDILDSLGYPDPYHETPVKKPAH